MSAMASTSEGTASTNSNSIAREEKGSRKRKELIFFTSLPGVRLPRTKVRGALIGVRS